MSDEITAVAVPPHQEDPDAARTRDGNGSAEPARDEDEPFDPADDDPVPSNKFAFSPAQLHKLLTARSLAALGAFGGLPGLIAGLRTDPLAGLSGDETSLDGAVTFDEAVAAARDGRPANTVEAPPPPASGPLAHGLRIGESHDEHYADRKRVFGENRLPRRQQKSFLKLMWIAFNDKLIILLTISASISLAIGIYQSVSAESGSSKIEWVDGVTVVIAILVIVFASAATDWQKNYKFKKLNERKEQRDVPVIRSGKLQHISIYDIMVGDMMHTEAGDVIAVDGVLVHGSSLQVDESSISGEADLVHKTGLYGHQLAPGSRGDPFILSGTTVARGVGRYLVTSVGVNSTYGRTLMSLRNDVEETPLQAKLGRLGKQLITFGAIAGSIFFLILFIRFCVNLKDMSMGPSEKGEAFLHVLILSITVVVITVPEGLALNVTIALAFATKRMLKDNNLVRLLRSCEIMGNATCVCSDKTGTLTQNKMTVVAGRVGLECAFDDTDLMASDPNTTTPISRASTLRGQSSAQLAASLSPEVRRLIKDSIALNSTAFESDESGQSEFLGSSTETALLNFSRVHLAMDRLTEERANCPIISMLPFDSTRKWMAVLIKLPNGKYRLLVKGAAEVVFEYCAYIVRDPTYKLPMARLSEEDRNSFRNTIQEYADKLLRPVAIGYRDFSEHEVFEGPEDDPDSINLEWLASGMIFVSVFGLRDPLRPEVVDSVRKCQEAGVFVRMVTGDNFATAKAIAAECGIFTAGGVAMDGPTFRDLTPAQLDAVIPRLQVLARSSPEDKLLLVSHLKGMKETVAVTGDGTNDALALKAADVGFAMGIQGTEVAKEAASIILLDDNFASIVKGLGWGRTVNDAVKKFCQFQFTINITAGIITVVSELVGDSIFTVVQLLWINLIMDIFASLGLATDNPSPDFLKRRPEPRNAPIVSITMWKMVLGQAIYQLAVVFTVHYTGWDLFSPNTEFEIEKLQTLVFNIYVWMQFFNQHNCRRVDNKLDIWYQGVLKNPWFIGVQCLTILGQFIIIFRGGEAFDTRPLTGAQWGWSLLFGVLTIPVGALIRQFPDRLVLEFFHWLRDLYLTISAPFRACLSRFSRKKTADVEQTPREMGAMGTGTTLQHTMSFAAASDGSESPVFPEQREALARVSRRAESQEKPPRYIDLQGLVDAARLGRHVAGATLELHPETWKDDPILASRGKTKVPPSQDAEIMRFVAKSKHRPQRRSRRQVFRERRANTPQVQARQTGSGRGSFSWEWFLRSKRR